MKKVYMLLLALCAFALLLPVQPASAASSAGKILFVPHDGRPVSDQQTADVVRKLGYDVIVPPQELLGESHKYGPLYPTNLTKQQQKDLEKKQQQGGGGGD